MPLSVRSRRLLLLQTVVATVLLVTGLLLVDEGHWRTLLIGAGAIVSLATVPMLLALGGHKG